MADRFYINCPLAPGEVVLEGAEAHHLVAVSRLRPGDAVCLFNGDGREYAATVLAAMRRQVRLQVNSSAAPARELLFALEVAAPLPKGDRAQFLVEKLTELGVTRFVPLATQRSVVHPREARREKLQRYVIETSKQCGRNVLMEVLPLADWAIYRAAHKDAPRLLAHPNNTQEPISAAGLTDRLASAPAVCLAVGTEGGFTEEEIRAAQAEGWSLIALGPRILRVETAALVLAALTIQARQGSPTTRDKV